MKKKYSITGIDCANCAAKLEQKMNELPEVKQVVLSFTTSQLYVEAQNPDSILPELQALADKMEPGTKIEPLARNVAKKQNTEHHHEHSHDHEHCGEHGHEHKHCDEHKREHYDEHEHCDCHNNKHKNCHGGHHDHQKSCDCHTHTQQAEKSSPAGIRKLRQFIAENSDFITLPSGILFFLAAMILENVLKISSYLPEICFVISYIILGGKIVVTAIKNLFRGKVFDENFLMSIATVGAFIVGDFAEAVGVMLFYRIGELFEDIAVNKSRKQIMDAVDMRPEIVRLYQDGVVTELPPEEIQIGDCIEIRPGDRIPLDGVVLEGESRIDTSAVTGEPVPVAVKAGSQILSGCVNTSGILYLKVEKALEDSMVTRILEAVENAAASKPKMDRFITKFARIYTPFVVVLALATAIVPSLFTGNWSYWIYTALTFLIISCPCALVLSVPLAFFAGIGAGSKRGILFKGGVSLETLADIKAVVMDKTGTITEGNFKVESITVASGYTEDEVLSLAASAESASTHPIATSILEEAKVRNCLVRKPKEVTEFSGEGVAISLDDKKILCGNQKLLNRYNIAIPEDNTKGAGTEVFVACENEYAGRIQINDIIKKDSKEAIRAIASKGIYTIMLTGDTYENAQAIQQATGIDEFFARQMPEDKLNNLQKIREEKGSVMFIGDGINDAPVLAGADVGAAMGSGADAAIEAADVVFMTSRLTALVESYRIAKATARIAKQNVIFALAVKAAIMVLGLCGIASMWMAVFADSGVAMLCVLNAIRVLYKKYDN
ncbi:MAG: heavy metal translocating P-type ATPase [Butyribacter sp.]|nr:heavy metal translocating P-type ATPase [bacterium]MDY3854552.1 heavy metal translocating P-type ATPase [Butyribacter sp.]